MMLDLPPTPQLWMPKKPAIIRPADSALLKAMPSAIGMFAATKGVLPAPVVKSITGTYATNSTSSYSINLGSVAAGDMIVVYFGWASVVTTVSGVPSGFSLLAARAGSQVYRTAYYKQVATGSEGASVTFTMAGSITTRSAVAVVLSGASTTQAPEVATASGTSTSADPPNITPSWGAKNTMILAFCWHYAGMTAGPSGYSNVTISNFFCGGANKAITGASENPPAYTGPSSAAWVADTVAVSP